MAIWVKQICLAILIVVGNSEVTECFANHVVKSNSKFAISLVAIGNDVYRERSIYNKMRYASLNGYDFFITEDLYDRNLGAS